MAVISPAWFSWPETQALIKAFQDNRALRFVGGCVRDALLGREVKDVDAATILLPQQVMEMLAKAGIKVIPTGIDHGTVTAVIAKRHFEITTLRRDVSTDGRHATVAFTDDWQQDAARRDFTMNALYCDAEGNVTDYFEGAADALAGRIRFIGDAGARIEEDAMRILRFFRFFAHYGKAPVEKNALNACAALALHIEKLSGERIQQEMMKLLIAERAAEAVDMMQQKAIWPFIIPHTVRTHALQRLPAMIQKGEHHPDAILSLAALLRSIQSDSASLIDAIAARWKLSRAHQKHLQELGVHVNGPGNEWNEKTVKKHIRKLGRELFIEHMILRAAEGADETEVLAAIRLARNWAVPAFPLTGDDILATRVKAGKEIGVTLKTLEEYWEEENYLPGKEELLRRI